MWSDLLNVEREAKPLEGADANASPADAAVASLTTAKFVWFEKDPPPVPQRRLPVIAYSCRPAVCESVFKDADVEVQIRSGGSPFLSVDRTCPMQVRKLAQIQRSLELAQWLLSGFM